MSFTSSLFQNILKTVWGNPSVQGAIQDFAKSVGQALQEHASDPDAIRKIGTDMANKALAISGTVIANTRVAAAAPHDVAAVKAAEAEVKPTA